MTSIANTGVTSVDTAARTLTLSNGETLAYRDLVLALGAASARFRDIPPIVASAMQLVFFVTPVIWKPEQLGNWQRWLFVNPLFDLLEIVRAPLLGDPMSASVWIGALVSSLGLIAIAWVFFIHARGRLAFWV